MALAVETRTAIERHVFSIAAGLELNVIEHEGRDYSVIVAAATMFTYVTAVIIILQVITKNNEFFRLWSSLGCFS